MSSYLLRAPGQKCTRCGKDISDRAKGTQHCSACQHIIDTENAIKRKERKKLLEARDTVMPPIHKHEGKTYELVCAVCGARALANMDTFCRQCEQRLKEGKECQTLSGVSSVESSKRKKSSVSTPKAKKTALKDATESAKAVKQ
jgi:hypothetical protein